MWLAKTTTRMPTRPAYSPASSLVSGRRQYIELLLADHDLAQLPHRQEHAQSEDQHEDAENDGDDRLDVDRQVLDFVVDLPLVHVGDLVQEVIHLARFLAHGDHLQNDGREHTGRDGGAQDALTPLHALAHLL